MLWGERASAHTEVWFDEVTRLDTISYQPGTLVVSVADLPVGEHRLHLVDGTRQGPATTVWLTREPGRSSWYRVVEVGLPLYSDSEGQRRLENVTGVRLAVHESGVRSERIVATQQTYQVGHYVDWGSQSGTTAQSGPVWVRDYPDGPFVRVWDQSILFDGQPLAPAHSERLMKISMEPRRLVVRSGQNVPLRVLRHLTDGTATWTTTVVSPEVTTTDEKVATFKGGVVHAKAPGSVTLRCVFSGCYTEIKVEVAAHPRGTVTELLTGLPPVSGVAWTPRGLVVSTRGNDLLRVDSGGQGDGAYRCIAAVPSRSVRHHGTDTLAARHDGELAVRLVGFRDILILHQDDDYVSSHWVTPKVDGVPTACIWGGEDIVLAMNTGRLYRVDMDGTATSLATIDGPATDMTWMSGFLLVLARTPGAAADSLWQLPLDDPNNAIDLLADERLAGLSGVLWTGSEVLLTEFHTGKILQLRDGQLTTLASGLTNPSQMAMARSGDIYVAEFGAGGVRRVLA